MNKVIVKKIILGIFFLSILFLIEYLFNKEKKECPNREYLQTSYYGIIKSNFQDPSNHGLISLKVQENNEIKTLWYYSKLGEFWKTYKLGDSIIKKAGSDTIFLKRNTTVFMYNVDCPNTEE